MHGERDPINPRLTGGKRAGSGAERKMVSETRPVESGSVSQLTRGPAESGLPALIRGGTAWIKNRLPERVPMCV